jgi:hypothetical protein
VASNGDSSNPSETTSKRLAGATPSATSSSRTREDRHSATSSRRIHRAAPLCTMPTSDPRPSAARPRTIVASAAKITAPRRARRSITASCSRSPSRSPSRQLRCASERRRRPKNPSSTA